MARSLHSSIAFGVLAFIAVVGLALTIVGIRLGYEDKSPSGHTDGAYFSRWWAVILEAVVALAIGVVVLSGNLAKFRTVSIAFLVVASSVVMATLHCALFSVEVVKTDKRNAEFAAGGLALLAITNLVSIILLGVGESSDALVLPTPNKSGGTWSLRKIISSSVFVVTILSGWGLMLAGTIAKQVDCATNHNNVDGVDCEIPLRFTWWTVAFEFAVMIWVVFAMGLDCLERMGAAIAGFIALVTVNLMDEAEKAVDSLMDSSAGAGPMEKLVAAGVLILCICNLLVIMFFAVGGVMKVHEEEEEGVSQAESTEWVSGATIAFFPLVLALALALGGVVRVHLKFCEGGSCNTAFRSSYWAFAFELLVVIGMVLLATLKRHALPRVRGFVVTLLVLASAETMREVGELLRTDAESLFGKGANDHPWHGYTSLGISVAGFMTVTAMNFVLLLVLGMEGSSSPDGYQAAPV